MPRWKFKSQCTAVAAALMLCLASAAFAEEAPEKAEALQPAAAAKPDVEAAREFKPPPGFRTKKRGELVLYCRREAVLGSRFTAEKCYDQAGIREMQRLELQRAEELERMRACAIAGCST